MCGSIAGAHCFYVSYDHGLTWDYVGTAAFDPRGIDQYTYTGVRRLPDERLMFSFMRRFLFLGDCPCVALSEDGGLTWAKARSTGIKGQTMTPVPLGGDRLLVLYNRRYGDQGVMMCLATFTEKLWNVKYEGVLYNARKTRSRPDGERDGTRELQSFEFGFPTAIPLADGTFLATFWCKEEGRFGINWAKLVIDW